MKRILFSLTIILALSAAPTFARSAVVSLEEHLSLPKDLSFVGHTLEIQHRTWFANFFKLFESTCSDNLTSDDMAGPIEIASAGPKTLALQFNGRRSKLITGAKTSYVPVHTVYGEVIHPYFLVETAEGWKFHVVIHKSGSVKTLSVFLLKGRPGSQTFLPIFTAQGV